MDVPKQEVVKDILDRLASAHGHLGGVRQMVGRGAPYPQVIYQLRAVRKALLQIEQSLIEQHLRSCLRHKRMIEKEELLDEVLELLNYTPTPRSSSGGSKKPTRSPAIQSGTRRREKESDVRNPTSP